MPQPLTDQDREYIVQARGTVLSLMEITCNAEEDPEDLTYTMYLDAVQGYVADASAWLHSKNLYHHEMPLVHAAVAVAVNGVDMLLERLANPPQPRKVSEEFADL